MEKEIMSNRCMIESMSENLYDQVPEIIIETLQLLYKLSYISLVGWAICLILVKR